MEGRILKFKASSKSPKAGDLVMNGDSLRVIRLGDNTYPSQDVVITPYGVSDEEITVGDKYYCAVWESLKTATMDDVKAWRGAREKNIPHVWFKVSILPEQFDYQAIVDLGLRDGDEFNVMTTERYDYTFFDSENGKVVITKPTPVTYTEEDMEEAFKAGTSFGIYIGRYDDDDIKKAPNFKEWFDLNKKKQ
jgi:hypothetical protein